MVWGLGFDGGGVWVCAVGIDELLEAIVQQLPPPTVKDSPGALLKALVFDSFYDAAKGVVLVAVIRVSYTQNLSLAVISMTACMCGWLAPPQNSKP